MRARTRRMRHRAGLPCAVGLTILAVAACSSAGPAPAPTTTIISPTVAPTLEPDHGVVVNGKTIHARCAGRGPSIVLVSGYGAEMSSWDPVQERIAAMGRTCAYNRLGIGHSDAPPATQDIEALATQLDGVITGLALSRPAVVVAESLGGPIAFTWAARHPHDAAALVLLDPITPGYLTWFSQHLPKPDASKPEITSLLKDVAVLMNPKINQEHVDLQTMALVAQLPVITTPLRLVQAGRGTDPLPGIDSNAQNAAWWGGQQWLARRSTNASVIVAPRSGHYIPGDDPNLVVDTVKQVLQ